MTTIKHKRGAGVPSPDDLEVGEIAIDTSTGTAYTKASDGDVVPVGGEGGDPDWAEVDTNRGRIYLGDQIEIYNSQFAAESVIIGTQIKGASHSVMIGSHTEIKGGEFSSDAVAIGNSAYTYNEGTAVGSGSTVDGYAGVALGRGAVAQAREFAIGSQVQTVNFSKATVQAADYLDADGNSIIGAGGGGDPEWANVDKDESSTALGWGAIAGYNGMAVGYAARAEDTCVAVGYTARAESSSTAVGYAAEAEGRGSVALGRHINSRAEESICIGEGAETGRDGYGSICIGQNVSAGNGSDSAIVLGTDASTAEGANYSIALGFESFAEEGEFALSLKTDKVNFSHATVQAKDYLDADGNSIIGAGGGGDPEWANVTNGGGTCLGYKTITGAGGVSVGYDVVTPDNQCVLLGIDIESRSSEAVVVGRGVGIQDNSESAIGIGSNVDVDRLSPAAICIGRSARIGRGSESAIALGDGAGTVALAKYSIALGAGVTARAGEFALSTKTDKVNFSHATVQAKEYLDADGNPATVSPSSIVEAFTTLQTAVADEDTVEGIKTALTNALGGLIEKFESKARVQE